jgi:hypothetical protein
VSSGSLTSGSGNPSTSGPGNPPTSVNGIASTGTVGRVASVTEDNRGNPVSKIDVLVPEFSAITGEKSQISAFSKQALNEVRPAKIDNYHLIGKLKIAIKPFDNIFKFLLANKSKDETRLEPFDLTNCNDVKLVIKTDDKVYEFPQIIGPETVARLGSCQFKIPETRFLDIKQTFNQGFSIFYITNTAQGMTNVIYAGLYTVLDTAQSLGAGTIQDLLNTLSLPTDTGSSTEAIPSIITPQNEQEIAIVTRRKVPVSSETALEKLRRLLQGPLNNTNGQTDR